MDAPKSSSPSETESDTVVSETDAQTASGQPSGDVAAELEQLNNQYLRLAADFDNFRKRQASEREQLLKYGAEQTMLALLPVLDNLKLALKNLDEDSKPEMLYKSFKMLSSQLNDALGHAGLKLIHTDSRPFDPQLHEALSFIETADFNDGTIVETYKDGYTLNDRVIRAAQVVVSKAPDDDEVDQNDGGGQNEEPPVTPPNPFEQASKDE
ncbi:MAG: nucleotide exchange factor GrpE [Cyanobacteria bacterium HKST-UBA06]|nr:nucleotide exchange factor GrpE [Cyanobacteria bacterium HKST-UBA04]MCA9807256.1 nucleotide exchange factor GrpE [Cyanobacteria bacterium HKST-UBA06]MCA9841073.1 nucleotide exchange factor GrpE [Cyanobacteria bacterium HKST-UBA03]